MSNTYEKRLHLTDREIVMFCVAIEKAIQGWEAQIRTIQRKRTWRESERAMSIGERRSWIADASKGLAALKRAF